MAAPIRLTIQILVCLFFVLGSCSCGGGGGSGLPSALDAAQKANQNLGGEIAASNAVLRAMNRGYSLQQIADAIESNSLSPDGSISGVSQAGAPQGLIVARQISETALIAALGDYDDEAVNVTQAILLALNKGYSLDQVIEAVVTNFLAPNGDIYCSPTDEAYGRCFGPDGNNFISPAYRSRGVYDDSGFTATSDDTSDDGAQDDNSLNWLLRTWVLDGVCPTSGSRLHGSLTFKQGGVLDYNWTLDEGSSSSTTNSSGTWTLSGDVLTINVGGVYSGTVNESDDVLFLTSDFCWSLTLAR